MLFKVSGLRSKLSTLTYFPAFKGRKFGFKAALGFLFVSRWSVAVGVDGHWDLHTISPTPPMIASGGFKP